MTITKGTRWGRVKAIGCAVLLLCLLVVGMAPVSYAVTPTPAPSPVETEQTIPADKLQEAENAANALITGKNSFLGQVIEFYKMVRKIAAGLSLCSIAGILLSTFWANQSDFEKNIKKIFMIIAAMAALYLVPYAINIGLNFAKSLAWRPGNI